MLTVHTAHFSPLLAVQSSQSTLCVYAHESVYHPSSYNEHLSMLWKVTSISQNHANPLLGFGSISRCAGLLDGMSDDCVMLHLHTEKRRILTMREASACPTAVLFCKYMKLFWPEKWTIGLSDLVVLFWATTFNYKRKLYRKVSWKSAPPSGWRSEQSV